MSAQAMARRAFLLLTLAGLCGCVNKREEALGVSALLMHEATPDGYSARLGTRWLAAHDSAPMSETTALRISDITRTPLVSEDELNRREPSIAVLALDPPRFLGGDTVQVFSAWVMLTGGDGGGGWGHDYLTYLRCGWLTCTVLSHEDLGGWN
jgi:hypothetical protein